MERNFKGKIVDLWKENRIVRAILIAESAVLLLLLANCFRGRCDRLFSCGDLYTDSDLVQIISTEDAGYYYVTLEENIEETTILHTDYFSLYPGAYQVRIYYTSQVNYDESVNYNYGNGYFYLTSVDDTIYTNFSTLFLRNGRSEASQSIRVTSPWKLSGLQMKVTYFGLGEMTVSSVEVREIVAFRYLILATALLLFVVCDLIAYFLLLDRNFHKEKELGILTLICLAAVIPFIAEYTFFGHDIPFHLQRILFLAEELVNGNYFPAILSQALNGYGYASPLYYGQVFLYIPAILYNCGLSLTEAYNAYVCLISIGTCLIMYYCARKIFRGSNAALTAAALYTLSAVRLTNIFTRAAVGEYTAQMFFPLVFLGFYQIYTAPQKEKITIRKYLPAVIGLTGLIVSHLLSVVMCAMVIAAFCVLMVKKTLEKTRLIALIKAALLTVFISLAQLLPMLSSMSMDINAFRNTNYIQESGAYLLQILNSVVNNYQASGDESGYAYNEMSYSIGFSVALGLVLFVVWMIRRKKRETKGKDGSAFAAFCFCATLLMVFLSTKAFFYDYLDFLPEKIYSVLTVYQFPWRWLSFAALFGVFCTAAVVDSGEFDRMFTAIPVTFLLGAVLVVNTGQICSDQLSTSANTTYQNKYYLDFAAAAEYLLYGTNVEELYETNLIYDKDSATAENYVYEDNQWKLFVENFSEDTITVDIPVLNYDHYVAYDTATGESIAIETGENNRIRLCIPTGYAGMVAVKYQLPVLWKSAIALSLATDMALIVYALILKRKRVLRNF